MEEKPQQNASGSQSLADIDFPIGDGPKPHPPRFIDPRIVEAHFAPLIKMNHLTPEERWSRKANATPFPGL